MELRVWVLARFEVMVGQRALPAGAWRRRRAAELLQTLALAPNLALSRDSLLEALWPDKDAERAANNLHRALFDLREILG